MSEEIIEKVEETVEPEEAVEEVKEDEMAKVVRDPSAPIVSVKRLLEAGVHYGHQTRKWNPKMKKYIYCPRNGIYIIDLNKTKEAIETAYEALKNIVSEGGKVLFVGTKQQAKQIIEAEALRSGSFYVTNRWLGGVLTNFKTISTRIKKLKDLEQQEVDGSWDKLSKKEVIQIRKLKEKLQFNLDGIKEMRKAPNAVIVVDPTAEHNAVYEALKLNIPVFAICDTNCNPDNISNVIPGNDDATKSIQLIVGILADAIVEAKGGLPVLAHIVEEGEEATMKDAVRQADRENALRVAARREMQREKAEKEKQRRAQFEARRNRNAEGQKEEGKEGEAKAPRKPRAPRKPKTEEAPVAEVKAEEAPVEEVKVEEVAAE